MKTEIQAYLQTHTLEELAEQFGIGAKRHQKLPNLVMLKYSQINSPMAERIVQECRGIILDEADEWAIVSRPYDKFFNCGEGHAPLIDWSSARVYEKIDGSLMTLYWYRNEWHVASSGLPDASGPVNGGVGTFAELFWGVWKAQSYSLPTDTSLCFMFELCTPHNRVVVPHVESRLYLHGARNVKTQQEYDPDAVANHEWLTVWTHDLGSVEDCIAAAGQLKPMEREGYVVVDKHFRRIKVKSPQYVALAHMKDNFTAGRMLELVRTNEGDEFLGYFPELRPEFEKVRTAYDSFCAAANGVYESIRGEVTQKDFAMKAKNTLYAPVLFAMRNSKATSPQDFIRTATITAAVRLLGLKESQPTLEQIEL